MKTKLLKSLALVAFIFVMAACTTNCDDSKNEYKDGYAAGKLVKLMGGYGSCDDYVKSHNRHTGRNSKSATTCYCAGYRDGINGKPSKY